MSEFKVIFKNLYNEKVLEQDVIGINVVDLEKKANEIAEKLLNTNTTVLWEAYALITKGNISR